MYRFVIDRGGAQRLGRAAAEVERTSQDTGIRRAPQPPTPPAMTARVTSLTLDADGNYPGVITWFNGTTWVDADATVKLRSANSSVMTMGRYYRCHPAHENASGETVLLAYEGAGYYCRPNSDTVTSSISRGTGVSGKLVYWGYPGGVAGWYDYGDTITIVNTLGKPLRSTDVYPCFPIAPVDGSNPATYGVVDGYASAFAPGMIRLGSQYMGTGTKTFERIRMNAGSTGTEDASHPSFLGASDGRWVDSTSHNGGALAAVSVVYAGSNAVGPALLAKQYAVSGVRGSVCLIGSGSTIGGSDYPSMQVRAILMDDYPDGSAITDITLANWRIDGVTFSVPINIEAGISGTIDGGTF